MDVNEIEATNDIEAPQIPQHLLDLIHQPPSVDPEPEEVVQVENDARVDVEKVAEENPQSRFRILDTAIQKPGTCLICRSAGGDGRQFVDFQKTVDFYGVVYVCTFCAVEVAKLLGLTVKQESFDGMRKGFLDEIESSDERWVQAQEEIRAARLLLRNCNCNDSDPVSDGSIPDAVDVEVVEESDGARDYDSESSSVEGLDDVSATSDDDESKPAPKRRRSNSSA